MQLPCSPALAFLDLWPPSPLATIHGSFASPGTRQCCKNGINASFICIFPVGASLFIPGAARWHTHIHTQLHTHCAVSGERAERGGGPTGVNQLQARAWGGRRSPITSPALVTEMLTQTNQVPDRAPWAREDAQRGPRGSDRMHKCTVQAATTCWTRGNCAVQPSLPYAILP